MLIKFKMFESLFIPLNEGTQDDIEKKVKDFFGIDLYSVHDFETFVRPDEPEQVAMLFADKTGKSFSLNYAGSKLYSIDFWKKDSGKPEATLYAQNKTLDEILPSIKMLLEDPKPGKDVEAKNEAEMLEKLVSKKATDKTDVDDGSIKKFDAAGYEFQDSKTIFDDLIRYTKMVIKGDQPALLVTGSPGSGKSFIVNRTIKEAGLKKDEDWFNFKGKSTAAAMYVSLYEHNGKLLVFDDCDSIFKDENAVNVLKGALDSSDERDINWGSQGVPLKTSKGEKVPQKFSFTGQVIFITNKSQKSLDEAIKSRSFVIEVALSPKDMVEYVEKLMPKIMPDESMSLKKVALNTIKSVAAKNENVQINMRTLIKSIKILKNVDDLVVARRMITQQCSYR